MAEIMDAQGGWKGCKSRLPLHGECTSKGAEWGTEQVWGRGCEESKLTEGVCSGRARLQVLMRTFGTLKMSSHFL